MLISPISQRSLFIHRSIIDTNDRAWPWIVIIACIARDLVGRFVDDHGKRKMSRKCEYAQTTGTETDTNDDDDNVSDEDDDGNQRPRSTTMTVTDTTTRRQHNTTTDKITVLSGRRHAAYCFVRLQRPGKPATRVPMRRVAPLEWSSRFADRLYPPHTYTFTSIQQSLWDEEEEKGTDEGNMRSCGDLVSSACALFLREIEIVDSRSSRANYA